MGKSGWLILVLGISLGANATLLLHDASPPVASGQTVDTSGGYSLATGRIQGKGEADALYIWSHADKKLAVYFENGNRLELLHVRKCEEEFSHIIANYKDVMPKFGDLEKEAKKQ